MRTVLYILTPEGKLEKEYSDFWHEGMVEPVDCRPTLFLGLPFTLTTRIAPGLTDEEDDFEWMVIAEEAKRLMDLRITNKRLQDALYDKTQEYNEVTRELERLEDKVKLLAETNRRLSEDHRRVSEDKMRYEEQLYTIESLLNKWLIKGYMDEEAIRFALSIAGKVGAHRIMGGYEHIDEILKKDREISIEVEKRVVGEYVMTQRTLEETNKRLERMERKLERIERAFPVKEVAEE